MSTTESLTEIESQLAHNIAITLVQDNTDVSEVGKVIAYLRSIINETDAGKRFFTYLKNLVNHGSKIGHSKQTPGYYRNIEIACKQYLQNKQDDAQNMLKILGWAMRLMRYYKATGIEEISVSSVEEISERQAEIAEVVSINSFTVGQVIEATITAIKGNKVTYEILGTIKITQKEPKKTAFLSEGQVVNVEIVELKDDGSIKKVRLHHLNENHWNGLIIQN